MIDSDTLTTAVVAVLAGMALQALLGFVAGKWKAARGLPNSNAAAADTLVLTAASKEEELRALLPNTVETIAAVSKAADTNTLHDANATGTLIPKATDSTLAADEPAFPESEPIKEDDLSALLLPNDGADDTLAADQPVFPDTEPIQEDDLPDDTLLPAAADVDEPIKGKYLAPLHPPNNKEKKCIQLTPIQPRKEKKSVMINPIRKEQEYDTDTTVAESLQEPEIVNSVAGERYRKELTPAQIDSVKDVREKNPNQQKMRIPNGPIIKPLQNYMLSDFKPHEYLENPRGLCYGMDPLDDPEKVVYAVPDDDHLAIKGMTRYLFGEDYKNTTLVFKRNALEAFYKKYVQGNWEGFQRRNAAKLERLITAIHDGNTEEAEAIGSAETQPSDLARMAGALEGLGSHFSQISNRQLDVFDANSQRQDATANRTLDAFTATSQRQDAANERLHSLFNSQRKDNKRKYMQRSNSVPRGRLPSESSVSMQSSPSTSVSTASSPSSNIASPSSSMGSPLQEQRNRVAPATERKARTGQRIVETPKTKTTSRKVATEAKPATNRSTRPQKSATSANLFGTPAAKKKTTTTADKSSRKEPPSTKKKKGATAVVQRAFKEGHGLPLNKSGTECGHCSNVWDTKKEFCTRQNHNDLLEEYTYVVEE